MWTLWIWPQQGERDWNFDNSTRHHLAFHHFNMMMSTMQFASYLLFLVLLPLVSALKFDMAAHHGHESASKERCIRNFVAKDQLVVVTANVDGYRGDGQQLNMHVCENIRETWRTAFVNGVLDS